MKFLVDLCPGHSYKWQAVKRHSDKRATSVGFSFVNQVNTISVIMEKKSGVSKGVNFTKRAYWQGVYYASAIQSSLLLQTVILHAGEGTSLAMSSLYGFDHIFCHVNDYALRNILQIYNKNIV